MLGPNLVDDPVALAAHQASPHLVAWDIWHLGEDFRVIGSDLEDGFDLVDEGEAGASALMLE